MARTQKVSHVEETQPDIPLQPFNTQECEKRGPEKTEELSPLDIPEISLLKTEQAGVLDIDDIPTDVPHRRYPQSLKPLFNYHPLYIDWDTGTWKQAQDQTAAIDLSIFVELYNADEIESKIVRLTSFGSGFSVGQMRKNEWKERGVFQDKLDLIMGPVHQHGLSMGENSPKTENQDATFTSTASTTVKVSGKSDGTGSGDASYSVSSSVSSVLSDYSVLNYSDGKDGRWTWEMTKMGAGDPEYTYPYDEPKSLVNFWGNILPVPGLARSTLFPACQAYWYAPLGFNDRVEFEVTAIQRKASVVSGAARYYASNSLPIKKTWKFYVEFNLDLDR